MTDAVYLDHNATTPLCPEARQAMTRAMETVGNPSSTHGFGQNARHLIEDSRAAVAALGCVAPEAVIFTSGGTEANNMALRGAGRATVFVGATEHPSVLEAVPDAIRVAVDGDGVIDIAALDALLNDADGAALVSVMAANNETGVLNPISEVAEAVHRHGAILHVDAIQAAGKIVLDEIAEAADMLSLSAHKLGGPSGVGALLVREDVRIEPLIRGGGQERRRRAGTENLVGIAGFAAAAETTCTAAGEFAGLARLRDRLEDAVRDAGAVIHGAGAVRLANTSCIGMPGVPAETQVMAFDLEGIAVSAGSACSSGKVRKSHVLAAMGLDDNAAGGAVRVSLGRGNTKEDIERFAQAWRALRARTASASAA